MKFTATLFALVAMAASATAHMAMLVPTPRGGYGTKAYNGRVHTFIGYKDKKHTMRFPCGGYPVGPVTNMRAGQTVNVRFYASGMKAADIRRQPKKPSNPRREFAQARHGGGLCEFSLSYDGGKSFRKIGQYTRSCPDAYYQWPVKIPANVPSCNKRGRCLFVWSWTANILPQYYQNCADINLRGRKNGKLPKKGIVIVDFPGRKQRVTAPGDGAKHKSGPGPNRKEISANLKGLYAR